VTKCHVCGQQRRTREASAWKDTTDRLLSLYEVRTTTDLQNASATSEGNFAIRVQEDWGLLPAADVSQTYAFLRAAMGSDHPLLDPSRQARLATDHGVEFGTSWDAFAEEIRDRNRYFPTDAPDRATFSSVFDQNTVILSSGTTYHRARVVHGTALGPSDLGAPPSHSATAGRANPAGIPYLYLANDEETCVYESRAKVADVIAIGTFELTGPLRVVDLTQLKTPNVFLTDGSTEEIVRAIHATRTLRKLRSELSRPVSENDSSLEYIPTQYICELAKDLGYAGVIYPSALHAEGTNLVLFDVAHTQCQTVRNVRVQHFNLADVQ
jgi:RES domain-containing protein